MNESSQVVIIGGGINGVSAAYHLAKQGASVTLLERDFIASGPTGRSGAIIRQHYSNVVTARMALHSLQVWSHFDEIVGGDPGFTQTGFMIGVRPEDVDGLKANIKLQKSVGIDTRFVTTEEMCEIEPHLDPAGLGGGAYEPLGGYCDPPAGANAFAQAARRLGAKILTGVTATSIRTQTGKVSGVETTDGFFPAGSVLVAAGPWSPGLLHKLGVEVPIIAARVKIGLYQRPQDFKRHCIMGDFIHQFYARPETGNLTMVGSISPKEAEDQVKDADNFSQVVEMDVLADFADRLASRFPAMESGHLASNYASLYDITPDWHAINDLLPGYDNLFILAGGSGHGFKLAPASGEMSARLILHGKTPEDDVNLFAFDRFAKGDLVRGQYAYSILG